MTWQPMSPWISTSVNHTADAKTVTFKTRGQKLGHTKELKEIIDCDVGRETLFVNTEEMFETTETTFNIVRSLATANTKNIK